MKPYLEQLKSVLENGEARTDRTGTGTLSVFGMQQRYDISKTFPLVTTKRIHWRSVVHELLWMLSGDTNIKYLQDNNVRIWDEWADTNGDLGPVYGKQWRRWSGAVWDNERGIGVDLYDQIADVIKSIRENPRSRRHVVSAWNPGEIHAMKLPPCHMMFQFYVSNDGGLSCHMYQRSADMFLGVPFNIASYSLLTYMIAQLTGLKPKEFVHTIGDAHIYMNHLEQVKEQLGRVPFKSLPTVRLNLEVENIDEFKFEDIVLNDYQSHGAIKAPVAV